MNSTTQTRRRDRILILTIRFILREVPAKRFVSRFMTLWKRIRGEREAIKEGWQRPFDTELVGELQQQRITPDEFSRHWRELWGYRSDNEFGFQAMIDRIFTACDAFEEKPVAEWEIDEGQLRESVSETLVSYIQGESRNGRQGQPAR